MSELSLGVAPARLRATSRGIQGFISGGTTANPTANQVLAYYCACVPGQIRIVVAAAISTAAATPTIVDVRKNGTSIWTNPAHRPTLPAGQSGVFASQQPDRGNIRPGDLVSLVVVQAGNVDVAMTAAIEEP